MTNIDSNLNVIKKYDKAVVVVGEDVELNKARSRLGLFFVHIGSLLLGLRNKEAIEDADIIRLACERKTNEVK